MTYSENNKIPVQCLNVTEDIVTIYRGQFIGNFEPFEGFKENADVILNNNVEEDNFIGKMHKEPYDASMKIPRFCNKRRGSSENGRKMGKYRRIDRYFGDK